MLSSGLTAGPGKPSADNHKNAKPGAVPDSWVSRGATSMHYLRVFCENKPKPDFIKNAWKQESVLTNTERQALP